MATESPFTSRPSFTLRIVDNKVIFPELKSSIAVALLFLEVLLEYIVALGIFSAILILLAKVIIFLSFLASIIFFAISIFFG